MLSQPDTSEQALDIADLLVRSGAIDCFVVDSVAALVPKAELEGEMGDSQVGLQARLMSKALRKLAGSLNKSRCAGIFINQIREKVGIMFGNPETTPGGRALKFWSSVRIELRRVENLKNGTDIVGSRWRAKVVKNKVPPLPPVRLRYYLWAGHQQWQRHPGSRAGIRIYYQRPGPFSSYNETRVGHGRDNARVFLDENSEIASEIENKIREVAMSIPVPLVPITPPEPEDEDEIIE